MKNYLIQFLAVLIFSCSMQDSFATSCNQPLTNNPTPTLPADALQATEENITPCDLQNQYETNQFPRFYWSLNKGLSQTNNQNLILELAFDLAKISAEKNDLGRAELIYQIILAHIPTESRAMSSYAVIHLLQEEYDEALRLLTKALSISPNDPLILNNLYTLSVLMGNYADASKFNKQLLKIESSNFSHATRRAIFDKLYTNKRNRDNWTHFIESQSEKNKAYWEQFDQTLVTSRRTGNFSELIAIGDQWTDIGMTLEALSLFDYITAHAKAPTAYFLKAKAFEQGKHYKLALHAAEQARETALSMDSMNKWLYGNILYETARLAYAANEYSKSLAFLTEYQNKGFSHPHLDYMFAVNLDSSGKHSEATPYFQKCSTQQIPDSLLNFCKGKLTNQISDAEPQAKLQPSKTIRIGKLTDLPSSILQKNWPTPTVSWLGEIIDTQLSETKSTLHIRWVAQQIQPKEGLEFEDGKHYDIPIEPKNRSDIFIVTMELHPTSEKDKELVRDYFTKEKYLIAQGQPTNFGIFNKQLAPILSLERAIFTSKINLIESN